MLRTTSAARPEPSAAFLPAAAEPREHRERRKSEFSDSVSPTSSPAVSPARETLDADIGELERVDSNFSNLSFKSSASLELDDAPAAAAPTANMADARDNAQAEPEPAPAAASRAAQQERAARMGAGGPPEQPVIGGMLELTSSLRTMSIGSAGLLAPQSSANSQASSLGLGDMDLPNFSEFGLDALVDHEVHKAEVMALLEGDFDSALAPGAQGGLPLRQAAPAEPEPEPEAGGAPKPESKKASYVPLPTPVADVTWA